MENFKRLDDFPYRHRISEVMSAPVRTATSLTRADEASQIMVKEGISSLVVVGKEGMALGIVTERDILRAVAGQGDLAPKLPLSALMSSPVATVPANAFIYKALGRMERLKIRHLVAVDAHNRPVGMVSSRVLLRLRVGTAMAIGDEIETAGGGEQLGEARARIPSLAIGLRKEGMDGLAVAGVISSVLRDITGRAAELAEEQMRHDGWGEAPAPWCVLVLGSGGRGESLFGADQDNAIVHTGDENADPWFAEAGRRIADTLDLAAIPYCKGGVMAKNPEWRRSVTGWRAEIDRWIREADGKDILNIDIFIDFQPVHGDAVLAQEVRGHLIEHAAKSPRFLKLLAESTAEMSTPVGLFGQFRLTEGRLDLKMSGLLPLVSAVRVLSVKHRIEATSTRERLQGLAAGGSLPTGDIRAYSEMHELMIGLLMRQQLLDIKAGIKVSNRINPQILDRDEKARLKEGFKQVKALGYVMQNALGTV